MGKERKIKLHLELRASKKRKPVASPGISVSLSSSGSLDLKATNFSVKSRSRSRADEMRHRNDISKPLSPTHKSDSPHAVRSTRSPSFSSRRHDFEARPSRRSANSIHSSRILLEWHLREAHFDLTAACREVDRLKQLLHKARCFTSSAHSTGFQDGFTQGCDYFKSKARAVFLNLDWESLNEELVIP